MRMLKHALTWMVRMFGHKKTHPFIWDSLGLHLPRIQ